MKTLRASDVVVASVAAAILLITVGCTNGSGLTNVDSVTPGEDAVEEAVIFGDLPSEDDAEDDVALVCLVSEDCLGQFPNLGPCEFAICDTVAQQCILGTLKDYTPCDDSDACTEATYCLTGACGNGFTPAAPTAPTCFEAACDPATGWDLVAIEGPCDDGNPCTDNDMCVEAACAGQPTPACDCEADADWTSSCGPQHGVPTLMVLVSRGADVRAGHKWPQYR